MIETHTRTGEFRVVEHLAGELHLYDLTHQQPVIVSTRRDDYDDTSLRTGITGLKPGNKILAGLETTASPVSTDLFVTTRLYRFTFVIVVDPTELYHAFERIPVTETANRVIHSVKSSGKARGRATLRENGSEIGSLVVLDVQKISPNNLVFEEELARLAESAEKPFYVFQTASADLGFIVQYYLTDRTSTLWTTLSRKLAN
jgi:hypothetical protein